MKVEDANLFQVKVTPSAHCFMAFVYSFLAKFALALPLVVVSFAISKCMLSGELRFYAKALVAIASLVIASTTGCVISCFGAVIGERSNINHYVGKFFAAITAPLVGIKFEVEGEEHLSLALQKSAVFISNHQSMLDLLTMGKVFPKRTVVLAKKSLIYYPILGLYMILAKNFFVNRLNRQEAIATLDQVALYMRDECVSVYIYPEGTRSHQTTDDMLPFKKGAFHLAIKAQVPIVCMVFSTYAPEYKPMEDLPSPSLLPQKADGRAIKHQRSLSSESILKFYKQKQSEPVLQEAKGRVIYSSRLKRFDGGTIRIKVLPPIETRGLTVNDVDSVIDEARTLMLKTLKDISLKNPKATLETESKPNND